jgi:hypothetical protein
MVKHLYLIFYFLFLTYFRSKVLNKSTIPLKSDKFEEALETEQDQSNYQTYLDSIIIQLAKVFMRIFLA